MKKLPRVDADCLTSLYGTAGRSDQAGLVEKRGKAMLLPARCRHCVTWTGPEQPTLWPALHLGQEA